ncbi:MAG: lytic transglycosylase domain-containing protein [Bacteroidales bacterium]|nr:lytic transglycosylase domain-containing protein [Bacteroidales bacterium]
MKKNLKFLVRLLFSLMLIIILVTLVKFFSFSKNTGVEDNEFSHEFSGHYSVFAVPIPEHLNFAGESVPTKKYDIFEGIDREFLVNTYWQSQTLLFIKRANKYFPIIEPILKKNNIPEDFKYIALAESGLMNVTSPSHAVGFWQFMKKTGQQYGLKVDKNIDERYHLEKSTQAACDYLNDAFKIFKNWTLVAASYNVGMGNLRKQLNKQQVSSYHDLYLNTETARYVYRIIAIKYILSNPEKYGFHFRKKDLYRYPEFRVDSIDTTINSLEDFAVSQSINLKLLKDLNPWIRGRSLQNPDSVKYGIKIPVKRGFFEDYFSEEQESPSPVNDSI